MQMEDVRASAGDYPLLEGGASASASMYSSAYMVSRVMNMVSGANQGRQVLQAISIFALRFDSKLAQSAGSSVSVCSYLPVY